MKRTFLLGVVLPFMLIFNSSNVHCIVGGQQALLGAFPSQVAIDLPNNAFCGGTIVNVNHVVTAARCVFNIQTHLIAANLVTVRSGVVDLATNPPRVNVVAIFPHPQYNPFTNQNNVAVLRVANNFQFPAGGNPALAAANMAEIIIPDAENCRVSGWNPTNVQPNPILQALINVPVMNRDICNTVAVHMGRVGESMLCAGNVAPNIGVCPATQGGGLICTINNNNLFVGVLTGGFGCGAANSPGIYTQVRVHRQWILQQFNRNDVPAAGPTPAPAGVNQPPNNDSGADKSLVSIFVLITSIFVALFKM